LWGSIGKSPKTPKGEKQFFKIYGKKEFGFFRKKGGDCCTKNREKSLSEKPTQ